MILVLMGVSSVGKTTLGKLPAARPELLFIFAPMAHRSLPGTRWWSTPDSWPAALTNRAIAIIMYRKPLF
jgi:hypothetical protein